MKGSHVISKFRFLEYGKAAPKGSRFKGIVNTASLIGWMDYTTRREAADQKKEQTMHDGGLLGYTSHNEDIRTYSSDGWLDAKKMNDFKETVSQSFCKNGNLCWDTVISLRDYTDSTEAGMRDVNDYAVLAAKLLPGYFKSMGLDADNMIWWMNYHSNKKNPHMHIVFLEKNQTRTRGRIPARALDTYKTMWLKELGMRQEFMKTFGRSSVAYMKEKDEQKQEMLTRLSAALQGNDLLTVLYSQLPKEGRLSYNSLPMKPFQKTLDDITDKILSSKEVKPAYDQWFSMVEKLDQFHNALAGDKISHFKETELKKLYVRIGNMILNQAKEEIPLSTEKRTLWFHKWNIRDQNDEVFRVRIPQHNAVVDIPRSIVTADAKNDCLLAVLSEDQMFQVSEYGNNLDSWYMRSPVGKATLNGKQLADLLDHKMVTSDVSAEKADVPLVKDDKPVAKGAIGVGASETPPVKKEVLLKEHVPRENMKQSRGWGIHRKTVYLHKRPMQMLRKGARRLLNQDERDKERDLEKFIRAFEEQQAGIEEKEI